MIVVEHLRSKIEQSIWKRNVTSNNFEVVHSGTKCNHLWYRELWNIGHAEVDWCLVPFPGTALSRGFPWFSWMLHPGVSVFLGGTMSSVNHTLYFISCLMMAPSTQLSSFQSSNSSVCLCNCTSCWFNQSRGDDTQCGRHPVAEFLNNSREFLNLVLEVSSRFVSAYVLKGRGLSRLRDSPRTLRAVPGASSVSQTMISAPESMITEICPSPCRSPRLGYTRAGSAVPTLWRPSRWSRRLAPGNWLNSFTSASMSFSVNFANDLRSGWASCSCRISMYSREYFPKMRLLGLVARLNTLILCRSVPALLDAHTRQRYTWANSVRCLPQPRHGAPCYQPHCTPWKNFIKVSEEKRSTEQHYGSSTMKLFGCILCRRLVSKGCCVCNLQQWTFGLWNEQWENTSSSCTCGLPAGFIFSQTYKSESCPLDGASSFDSSTIRNCTVCCTLRCFAAAPFSRRRLSSPSHRGPVSCAMRWFCADCNICSRRPLSSMKWNGACVPNTQLRYHVKGFYFWFLQKLRTISVFFFSQDKVEKISIGS